jgi:hypothetical protein
MSFPSSINPGAQTMRVTRVQGKNKDDRGQDKENKDENHGNISPDLYAKPGSVKPTSIPAYSQAPNGKDIGANISAAHLAKLQGRLGIQPIQQPTAENPAEIKKEAPKKEPLRSALHQKDAPHRKLSEGVTFSEEPNETFVYSPEPEYSEKPVQILEKTNAEAEVPSKKPYKTLEKAHRLTRSEVNKILEGVPDVVALPSKPETTSPLGAIVKVIKRFF